MSDHGKKDVGVNPNIQLTLILIVLVVIATIYAYFLFNYEIKLTDTNVQLLQPRSNANASLMCDNKILITGGFNSSIFSSTSTLKGFNSTEIYDIKNQKITKGPDMHFSGNYVFEQFSLPNCEIVFAGQEGFEIYNPTTNKIELVENNIISKNSNYYRPTYTLLKNGNLLISGGLDKKRINNTKSEEYFSNSAYIFDTKNKKIRKIENLPIPLFSHSCYLAENGDVYILGGETNSNGDLKRATGTYNSKIIKFDSKTERFSIVGDNTIKGSDNKNIECALDIISKIYKLNDKEVIVIGGTAADFNDYDTIYKLNLESCESELLYMTNKQLPGEHSIFKNNNKIYLQDTHSFFGGVNIFDVNKKTMKHQFSIKFQMGSTVIPICKNQFILISDDDNKIYNVEIKNK